MGELEDQQTTAASTTQQAAAETRALATGAVRMVTLPDTAPKEPRVVMGKDSVERVGSAGRQGTQRGSVQRRGRARVKERKAEVTGRTGERCQWG